MISIIVPIYNVSKYIDQCINSIRCQSYENLEIILVDDGSTDGCAEICDFYAQKDSRIVVVHKQNGGLVSARKAGIEHSHGAYIGYVDGDDWIEPDMYETLYQKLIENDTDIVMCGRFEDTANHTKEVFHGIEEGRYDKDQMIAQIYPRMIVNEQFFEWGIFPGVWDKLFKREILTNFQMDVDERIVMGEDAACVYPCLLNASSIYIVHRCLYHYRQTTHSMVKRIEDHELEKERFRILFQSVNEKLKAYASVYDLRNQWEEYVLFLMTPRADGLYQGFEKMDYLFPFPKVKRGMKIILYGAGTYGQRLYQYITGSGFCRIVLWVDQNYRDLRKLGLNVEPPSEMDRMDFEQIAVAITYAVPRAAVHEELGRKYGEEKVSVIDEALIKSAESKKAFGISNLQ